MGSFCRYRHHKETKEPHSRVLMGALLGTLRSNNGDVHANVAEKQTSHHFKLSRDYPISSCYLKEGDFGWSWRAGNALKFGQQMVQFIALPFPFPSKLRIWSFHVVVVQ